jgi:hypothetical protein
MFVNDIKKKYIKVYMNRSWSVRSGTKNSKINYTIININDSVKEKTCIQADKENEKRYRQFVEKAHKTSEKWQNTGAKMNLEVPKPPKPNNYERLIEFRKKNVLRPAIEQSKATLYLYKSGYQLEKDYEAHQAIELANSLRDYSKNLKKQKNQQRKSKLEDVLNVKNMSLTKHESSNSFDIDDFIINNRSSPTDSSGSSDESLNNSIEFTKQSELLETINEFKELEMKNKTSSNDLEPKNIILNFPAPPSAPPALRPGPSAPPAQRNYKNVNSLDC